MVTNLATYRICDNLKKHPVRVTSDPCLWWKASDSISRHCQLYGLRIAKIYLNFRAEFQALLAATVFKIKDRAFFVHLVRTGKRSLTILRAFQLMVFGGAMSSPSPLPCWEAFNVSVTWIKKTLWPLFMDVVQLY